MHYEVDKKQLSQYIGKELVKSQWLKINQNNINAFADVTHDHQFIHTDTEKASHTPYGGTIVHGMFVLSLLSHFHEQCGINIKGSVIGVNYGFDKVRFLAPVAVDSELSAQFTLMSCDDEKAGRIRLKYKVSVNIKGVGTPALIAEWVVLFFMK